MTTVSFLSVFWTIDDVYCGSNSRLKKLSKICPLNLIKISQIAKKNQRGNCWPFKRNILLWYIFEITFYLTDHAVFPYIGKRNFSKRFCTNLWAKIPHLILLLISCIVQSDTIN